MAQTIVPDADIAIGSWVPFADFCYSDLADALDSTYASNTASSQDTLQVGFANPASTPSGTTATGYFRAKCNSTTRTLTVKIFQGAVEKGTIAQTITTTATNYSFSATGITDYNDLSMTFLCSAKTPTVYRAYIEVPDAAGGSSILKVSGVAQASISKVSGVAEASINKVSGVQN